MIYNITVPKGDKYYNVFVETHKKYTLDELKERLYKEKIDEDLKDDLSYAIDMCVEPHNIKFFVIKHGFKLIELGDDKDE